MVVVALVAPLAILGLVTAVVAGPRHAGWRLVQRFRRPEPTAEEKT